jgi:hypothetical protein
MMRKHVAMLGLLLVLLPVAGLADSVTFQGDNLLGGKGVWSWNGVGSDVTGNSGTYVAMSVTSEVDTSGVALYASSTPIFIWDSGPSLAPSGSELADFGTGGTISLGLDKNGICTGSYCFSGTLSGGELTNVVGALELEYQVAFGYLDPGLLAALGLPTSPTGYTGAFDVDLLKGSGTCAGGAEYCGTWTSTELELSTATPEAGTLTLFGTGLLGLAAAIRRKLRKS